ncbi:MAG TPA: DUF5667 domain-containing protein, partial [Ktedonobacterales bacterium]|nr:DUF5667 domain-containing protein [Ktedonobacterales bacterium]
MTPVPEDLHDELERHISNLQQTRQRSTKLPSTRPSSKRNSEIEHPEIAELGRLAQQLQAAPSLQVNPTFARRLEERLLARHAVLQQRRAKRAGWNWSVFGWSRPRSAVVLALSLLLVVTVIGAGLLVAANQVGDPNNPLYTVKRWEQQVQVSLAQSSTDQAELHLQFARDQLTTLGNLTDTSKSSSYQQALANFDQQVTAATQEINALPAGPDYDRLTGELTTLQTNARQTLRGLLGQLALSERLLTTNELGRLGDDTVPSLTQG